MESSLFKRLVPPVDDFLKFNLNYLFIVGLQPNENWNNKQKILYIFFEIGIHIFTITFLFVTSTGIYLIRDDIPSFLKSLDKLVVAYNFYFKSIMFNIRRQQINNFVHDIQSSGDVVTIATTRNLVKLSIFQTFMSALIVGMFCVLAILDGDLVIEAWMPFDTKGTLARLLMTSQILSMLFLPVLTRGCAMLGFICTLIMYLTDHLKEIQENLINMEYTKESDMEVRLALQKLVQKHVRMVRYGSTMRFFFKEYFLIDIISVTAELCINAVMVLLVRDITFSITFLIYLGFTLSMNFIYCYLGETLINESEAVAQAAYGAPWTVWPVDLQKNLVTIIRNAQIPLQLTAGGFTAISIPTFARTAYRGYSIFAILNDALN